MERYAKSSVASQRDREGILSVPSNRMKKLRNVRYALLAGTLMSALAVPQWGFACENGNGSAYGQFTAQSFAQNVAQNEPKDKNKAKQPQKGPSPAQQSSAPPAPRQQAQPAQQPYQRKSGSGEYD